MRFLLKTFAFLLVVGIALAAAVLGWGHFQIRRVQPELPAPAEVVDADGELELPVRITWLNTASQRMPRAAVLDPERDPNPDAPYVMSHPAFAIEWQDGRIFLVDLGMGPEDAIDFGLPLEMAAGASPIEPHLSATAQLGDSRERVAGIGFTHLHADHTSGLTALCKDRLPLKPGQEPIALFQHHNQLGSANHTTSGARAKVQAADCVKQHTLGSGSGMLAVPGFEGLYAIPVAGHTPGSTMWVVQLRVHPGTSEGLHDDVETWVITGDVVNHVDGVRLGVPKPPLYSLLVVPENDAQLDTARRFLAELSARPGVKLLVNHDRGEIESTGIGVY
jgi:glyoxylase-like metal-dependent hydrolase (beta-lactamase superfamily II)